MPEPSPTDPDGQFEEAYERDWLAVFRFALAWTNDWSAAEDLAQDAFARLWSKGSTIDWSAPILPWLLTAARNLATDRFRRLAKISRFQLSGHSPALDSDARLRWLDVKTALAALTPNERAALVLTAVVGLDSADSAEALGTTPGAVRAAVSRARTRLAE